MSPTWEIHVPISPTPSFLMKVRVLAASLRRKRDRLADARIVVTAGDRGAEPDWAQIAPWAAQYGIEWRWVPEAAFATYGYYATALERLRHPFASDGVILFDADVLVARGFADVARVGLRAGGVSGVTAYRSPFRRTDDRWDALFAAAGLSPPARTCVHPHPQDVAAANRTVATCPPYFNLGVIIAPARDMARIGEVIYSELDHVESVVDTPFRCQMALTLAIHRLGLPWHELPLRMNFPNSQLMWDRYPYEAANMRILHYMATDEIDKDADFASAEALTTAVGRRELTRVGRRLQRHLGALLPEVTAPA